MQKRRSTAARKAATQIKTGKNAAKQQSIIPQDLPKITPETKMDLWFRKVNRRNRLNTLKVREEPGDSFIKMVVHLIHQGNVPETAVRALGVSKPQFKHWVQLGFDDITLNRPTAYAKFVRAIDMAMAQEEAKQISKISRRIGNWQAIAWTLERKAFGRWGGKQLTIGASFEDLKAKGEEDEQILTADVAGQVYSVLEEAGVLQLPGSPQEEETIDLTGPAVEGETVEAQFEEVVEES